ncbi:hypothetical protein ACFP2T_16510 [Plantactinospora solaniradicis]|uniref:Uncharacterized protein n=1 Tax=Plantactinospora solaniradicis TaxID=1723736 RepID=A0ABW1K8F2_9ACTN
MTIAFRADADVTNGTAGTSVVVARPTGTTTGDVLIAFVAATGLPTITAPAGWTLIGTQDASTALRIRAYWRAASNEPVSWTWTLGSSQRSWGWVGAWSGVDTTNPIYGSESASYGSGTSTVTDGVALHRASGYGLFAVAGVRTASGTGTTWTSVWDELADLSTNGGSGTDITGCVSSVAETSDVDVAYADQFTASQSQTNRVSWSISLRPVFTAYDGAMFKPIVEVAWGADPDGDPDLWNWTAIPRDDVRPGLKVTKGLQSDSSAAIAPPTSVTFSLNNPGGDYTPDNPLSPTYPNVVADTPIRVSVPFGFSAPTERALVFAESWDPTWEPSTRHGIVEVTAKGRLHRVQTVNAPVESAARRVISGRAPFSGVMAQSYFPCEDEPGATEVASAFAQNAGHPNAFVNFGSATDCPGSKPLPTLDAGAIMMLPVAPYAATGHWTLLAVMKMPETPVATTVMPIRILCSGTAPTWRIGLAPGSPDTMRVRAEGSSDIPLLDAGFSIAEAEVYGQWVLVQLSVTQNGANVDYRLGYHTATDGSATTGTLASRTIGAIRQGYAWATADTDGVAFGHFAAYTNATFSVVSDPGFIASAVLGADTGARPYRRFQAICDAAGLPHRILADEDIPFLPMGPMTPTTLPAALEECAATDQGLIHDGGPGGALVMVTRSSRYNADVDLTLNVDARELAPPFSPQYTTRDRVSDSTVSRSGGSSARYVDTSVRGTRSEQVTLSLDSDHYLRQIAGYRVNVSSTPGMRYPALGVNLRKSPHLVQAWLDCRIGSRAQAVNLWDSHGPAAVDQVINGHEETFTGERWDVVLFCAPARPFDVPVLEATDGTVFRADLAASTLASGINAAATSISVASIGALISTSGANYPCDIDVGGEQITVTACSGASSPQTLTVTRGQYARAHDAGTPIVLWRGRGVAL